MVSPNSLGFPGFPPRFFVVGDTSTSNLSTFQPWGQGAFGSVYEGTWCEEYADGGL